MLYSEMDFVNAWRNLSRFLSGAVPSVANIQHHFTVCIAESGIFIVDDQQPATAVCGKPTFLRSLPELLQPWQINH